jgi:hypothetical protein
MTSMISMAATPHRFHTFAHVANCAQRQEAELTQSADKTPQPEMAETALPT